MASLQTQFGNPDVAPFPVGFDAALLKRALANVAWCKDQMHGTGICADTQLNGQAVRISLGYAMLNRLGDLSAGAHLKEVSYLEVFEIINEHGQKKLLRLYLDYSPRTLANHGSTGALAQQFVAPCETLLNTALPMAEKLPIAQPSLSHESLKVGEGVNRAARVAAWRDLLVKEGLNHILLNVPEGQVPILIANQGQAPGAAAFAAIRALIDSIPNPLIAPATGATQIPLLQELVRAYQAGWKKIDEAITYNLDEFLGLSARNPQSYQAFMAKHLFDHVNIPLENIHFPNEQNSKRYSQEIATLGHLDLCIGGLGHNCHFGFNEPGSPFNSRTRCVYLDQVTRQHLLKDFRSIERVPEKAFTIGLADVLESGAIIMIAGPDKLAALKQTCFGPISEKFPSAILRTHPNFLLVVDQDTAAALLAVATEHDRAKTQ